MTIKSPALYYCCDIKISVANTLHQTIKVSLINYCVSLYECCHNLYS